MRHAGLLLLLCMLGLPTQAALSSGQIRRVAICVGADDGGTERQRLRFANSDAQSFCKLLEDFGGVGPGDGLLLLNPSSRQLTATLTQVRTRVEAQAAEATPVEFVFYYSGHSTEEGLQLGNTLVPYSQFRALFEAVPAKVRVAILDSCASGSFVRQKGGKALASYWTDGARQVSGQAVLTSSSASEASQESDRIRGSFFTHFLLTGLRGAADHSRDGQVTLTEAYQFAFTETLARTQHTRAGAQHPTYQFDLTGTGELVMTDLRQVSARLVLAAPLEGRLFIRDAAQQLLLEVRKTAGESLELGVPAGEYVVLLEHRRELQEAEVQVGQGDRADIQAQAFRKVSREQTALRGLDVLEAEMDSAGPTERPTQLAKGELVFFQTSHGIAQGAMLCSLVGCEPRTFAGTLMAGGVLGAGTSLWLSRDGIRPGQALTVNTSTWWGLAHGLLIQGLWESGNPVLTAMLSSASGAAVGGVIAATSHPKAGDVSMVNSFGIWSGTLATLGLGAIDDISTDARLLTTLGALDAGLVAGIYLSRRIDVSRGRMLLIDAGGLLGGLLALGSLYIVDTTPDAHLVAGVTGTGCITGIATAAYLTREQPVPDAPPLSLGLLPIRQGGAAVSLGGTW